MIPRVLPAAITGLSLMGHRPYCTLYRIGPWTNLNSYHGLSRKSGVTVLPICPQPDSSSILAVLVQCSEATLLLG